jgi:hypothetical protein
LKTIPQNLAPVSREKHKTLTLPTFHIYSANPTYKMQKNNWFFHLQFAVCTGQNYQLFRDIILKKSVISANFTLSLDLSSILMSDWILAAVDPFPFLGNRGKNKRSDRVLIMR